jgi:hypothetical protein
MAGMLSALRAGRTLPPKSYIRMYIDLSRQNYHNLI